VAAAMVRLDPLHQVLLSLLLCLAHKQDLKAVLSNLKLLLMGVLDGAI
jgi:hypothetical protein